MREALRVFTKVGETRRLSVRLQNIEGKRNVIADDLSRRWRRKAERKAAEMWDVIWVEPPAELSDWTEWIMDAGRRASVREKANRRER